MFKHFNEYLDAMQELAVARVENKVCYFAALYYYDHKKITLGNLAAEDHYQAIHKEKEATANYSEAYKKYNGSLINRRFKALELCKSLK